MATLLDVFPTVGEIISRLVPDPNKAKEITLELAKIEASTQTAMINSQKDIIVAEAGGNWLQRSWRPLLMLEVVAIVGMNYICFPFLAMFGLKVAPLHLPEQLWTLMTVGVGGYVVGRTWEKTAPVVTGFSKNRLSSN